MLSQTKIHKIYSWDSIGAHDYAEEKDCFAESESVNHDKNIRTLSLFSPKSNMQMVVECFECLKHQQLSGFDF